MEIANVMRYYSTAILSIGVGEITGTPTTMGLLIMHKLDYVPRTSIVCRRSGGGVTTLVNQLYYGYIDPDSNLTWYRPTLTQV